MPIECYYAACPHHSIHYGVEGPYCDEQECHQGIEGEQQIKFVRERELTIWDKPRKKCQIVHGPQIEPNHSGVSWIDVYDGNSLILAVNESEIDDEIIIFICVDGIKSNQIFYFEDLPGFDKEVFVKNMIFVLGYEL